MEDGDPRFFVAIHQCRHGRSALEHPIAAALRQAKRFHIEIQIADDDLLLVRVRIEPGVGTADLPDPLEIDRPFGAWQLPLGDQLDIGAPDLQSQRAARIIVVGALLDIRLEEVAADGYFLRGAAIARNFGMHDFLFVGHLFALVDGSDGDRPSVRD